METGTLNCAAVQPTGNDKIWSMLSHLSVLFGLSLILPLVVYLATCRRSSRP